MDEEDGSIVIGGVERLLVWSPFMASTARGDEGRRGMTIRQRELRVVTASKE